MSLAAAIRTSVSGLNANSRWGASVSKNVANANTEGYTRKEVEFSTRKFGGTTYVSDLRREVDTSMQRMHRTESSKMSSDKAVFEGLQEYTSWLGQPDDQQSVASKMVELENSLTTMVNNPGQTGIQTTVLEASKDMAGSLRDTSSILSDVKSEVKLEIKYDVADMNEAMHRVQDLNSQMAKVDQSSSEALEMHDEMDRLLDGINEIMEVQTTSDRFGRVNLYTGGGTALVEGDTVNTVSFDVGSNKMFAGDSEITPTNPNVNGFSNGSLGGLMTLNNKTLPQFQDQLDEFARGLVETFENADDSLGAGDAGLFTDNGAAFDPTDKEGLAARIQVNAAVDPERGGELWRIRDGVGATSEGPNGSAEQVRSFIDALQEPQTYAPGTNIADNVKLSEYGANMVAYQQTQRTSAEKSFEHSKTTADAIQQNRLSVEGVNVDDELQKMMLIEQSYAANSKTMNTVSKMMDTLIQMV